MIHIGDALDVLKTLAPESVQCCVTSPPYWGLRDYGTASWDGGDPDCRHTAVRRGESPDAKQATPLGTSRDPIRGEDCRTCGATRIDAQMGLERTPAEYVARMVEVFEEVRRVLRADGTLWLNLGDSYGRDPGKGGSGPNGKHDFIPDYGNAKRILSESNGSSDGKVGRADRAPVRVGAGLPAKNLVGIPWRMAFALQDQGWYLRSDIIWAKPNPMPESVTDRPTKSHEYVFLLSKSARYFYDADAIAETAINAGRLVEYDGTQKNCAAGDAVNGRETLITSDRTVGETRNARTVWTIATSPYPDAHFATFPPEIPRRCILAGSRHGDTVLDPFAGAGTTGLVASRLGRVFVGIELNPKYAEMAERRIHDDAPLLFSEDKSIKRSTPIRAFPQEEIPLDDRTSPELGAEA